jgi:ABC-2 type transport system ATP-binding protein
MNPEYIVEVDKVDKTFYTRHFFFRDEDTARRRLYAKKTIHAVNHVEFGIRPGEIFGLLGPNGAGKTTTVKMISGLIRPCSGAVYVAGLNVERKRLKVLRKVGVVLEGTRTSIWPLTPLENLAYFGNLKDVKGPILRRRSRELLEFIGLKDKMNIQVRRLSRGERQKLAVCIALVADPPVLLLDEPTTGIDVQSGRAIKNKVREMTRQQGKCVLVTTHDMHVAQELCDRIGIIDKGRLIVCQSTAELLHLFSDQVYEFRLDRPPDVMALKEAAGVADVEVTVEEDGPMCAVHMDSDAEKRSEAFYRAVAHFRSQGLLLRSVVQRQQNLEDVFLNLTSR